MTARPTRLGGRAAAGRRRTAARRTATRASEGGPRTRDAPRLRARPSAAAHGVVEAQRVVVDAGRRRLRTIISERRPSTSGRTSARLDGRDERRPSRTTGAGCSTGTGTISGAAGASTRGEPLHHLAVGERRRRRRAGPRRRRRASAERGERRDDVVDRDRLRAGLDPPRGDHRGQALDERARASGTTRCRGRSPSPRGRGPAVPVAGQDLRDLARRAGARSRRRRSPAGRRGRRSRRDAGRRAAARRSSRAACGRGRRSRSPLRPIEWIR